MKETRREIRSYLFNEATPLVRPINFQLCLRRVTLNSLTTDKPVALGFQIELEFGNVVFCGGRKTGEPGEKPSEQGREPTTNSTHI